MAKTNRKNTTDTPLSNFVQFIIQSPIYVCLGAYYILLYAIINPLNKLFKGSNLNNKNKKINIREYEIMSDKLGKTISKEKIKYNKKVTFRYKMITKEGKRISNTFYGNSMQDLYTFLTNEGYIVYSIEHGNWINFVYGESNIIYQKFSYKDLIFFTTQLSTYLKSGITLTDAVRLLSKQMNKSKYHERVLLSLLFYLTNGESFSSALSHQNNAFPRIFVNMVKAAEATGNLESALDDLVSYFTELDKTHKEMMTAISYPLLILSFSIIVIAIVMIKIVPQFISIYESAGAELSSFTKVVINISLFTVKYYNIMIYLLLFVIVSIYFLYKNVKSFRRSCQIFLMKLPVFGKIIIYNELTIFTKTFATLLKNDVFITDSINILSNLTNNEIYKEIMLNTINNIGKGEKISASFENHWAIPDVAYYMIVTGENTGELDDMMEKVSEYYQSEHKAIIGSLKTLIEPFMIIFLSVIVGGVILAVIKPMFDLYNVIIS